MSEVTEVVNVGDEIDVEVINVDDRGKIKVSRKATLPEPEGGADDGGDGEGRERGDRGRDRGDRGGRGRGDRDRGGRDRGGRDRDRAGSGGGRRRYDD